MIRADFYWPHIVNGKDQERAVYVTFPPPGGTVTITSTPAEDPPIEILECAVRDMYHEDKVMIKHLPLLRGMRW